jgi:hypothetical protein
MQGCGTRCWAGRMRRYRPGLPGAWHGYWSGRRRAQRSARKLRATGPKNRSRRARRIRIRVEGFEAVDDQHLLIHRNYWVLTRVLDGGCLPNAKPFGCSRRDFTLQNAFGPAECRSFSFAVIRTDLIIPTPYKNAANVLSTTCGSVELPIRPCNSLKLRFYCR